MVMPARWKHARRLLSVNVLTGSFEKGNSLFGLNPRPSRRAGATGR